jgi:hypothetical protein
MWRSSFVATWGLEWIRSLKVGEFWVCIFGSRTLEPVWLPVLETVFCFQNSKTCFWYQRARLGCCF